MESLKIGHCFFKNTVDGGVFLKYAFLELPIYDVLFPHLPDFVFHIHDKVRRVDSLIATLIFLSQLFDYYSRKYFLAHEWFLIQDCAEILTRGLWEGEYLPHVELDSGNLSVANYLLCNVQEKIIHLLRIEMGFIIVFKVESFVIELLEQRIGYLSNTFILIFFQR